MTASDPQLQTGAGDPVPDVLRIWLEPRRGAFTAPTWRLVLVLVMGDLLAPDKRTVSACLRVTGRAMAANCASCHQVLNRARWKPRDLAGRFARVLVAQLVEQGEPIIIGLDDTIERRWGAHIRARGIYRDPVRSSHGHFVKTRGLRWLSFMLLTPLPWLPGCKALPILTLLAPSQRWALQQGRRHKALTDRARQGMLLILRWFPKRSIIFVGDSSFRTRELADAIGRHASFISRLRLDASLFALPEPRSPDQEGRPGQNGKPLPRLRKHLHDPAVRWTGITLPRWYGGRKEKTLEILSGQALWYRAGTRPNAIRWVLVRDPEGRRDPQAFFCTDPDMDPARIIAIFVRRWQIEVTFQEVRAHLGVETQRQWSDAAIERTTPVLLGLYSLVCLWAGDSLARTPKSCAAAWYRKSSFTFSDAIAAVRTQLWLDGIFQRSTSDRERQKILPTAPADHALSGLVTEYDRLNVPPERIQRIVETLCFAA